MSEVWDRVDNYRRRVGCTIAQLARASGVSETALYNLKSGKPVHDATETGLLHFIARNPRGFPGAGGSRIGGEPHGATAVAEARRRSGVPARPCPFACARAAAEDAWRRMRIAGRERRA